MTPEAPVTEAGRVSARETMVHRLEAAVRRHGVTVAPNVWLDDLDAIEAEAVARDREALAAKVRGLPIRSKMTDAEFNVAVPHGFLSRDAVLAHVDRPALAATPSPAPTPCEHEWEDAPDDEEAWYCPKCGTREEPEQRADETGWLASPAPTAPLDVERLRRAIYEISVRHDWEHTTDREDRTDEIAAEYARLATPDQRPAAPFDVLVAEARAKVKTAIGVAKSARPADEWVIGRLEQVRERLDEIALAIPDQRHG